MNCSYCNTSFTEATAAVGGCHSCHQSDSAGAPSGCGMLKCPKCGYDNPQEIVWLKNLAAKVSEGSKRWSKTLLNTITRK